MHAANNKYVHVNQVLQRVLRLLFLFFFNQVGENQGVGGQS